MVVHDSSLLFLWSLVDPRRLFENRVSTPRALFSDSLLKTSKAWVIIMKTQNRFILLLIVLSFAGFALVIASLSYTPNPKELVTVSVPEVISQSPIRALPERLDRAEILLGASISTSGRYHSEGQRAIDGYELWREQVNKQGGIRIGSQLFPVQILYYDDGSQKSRVRENIRRLIEQDQVDFLLGPFSSGLTLEASAVSEEYGVILLDSCGASETIFARNPRATFAALTSASWYFKGLFDMLTHLKHSPQSYAVLSTDKLFPRSVAKGVRIWAEKAGVKEVYYGMVAKDTDNFIANLEAMAAVNPDIVIFAGHYQDSLAFSAQLADMQGFRPSLVGMTLGPSQRDYAATLGGRAEGMIGVTQWVANSGYRGPVFGSAQQYAVQFEQRFGYPPTYQNAQASASGVIYQLALERSRSLDADEILNNIRALDVETFYGHVRFDYRGLNIGHEMALVQIQNGRQVTIWPNESAQGALGYPLHWVNKR